MALSGFFLNILFLSFHMVDEDYCSSQISVVEKI